MELVSNGGPSILRCYYVPREPAFFSGGDLLPPLGVMFFFSRYGLPPHRGLSFPSPARPSPWLHVGSLRVFHPFFSPSPTRDGSQTFFPPFPLIDHLAHHDFCPCARVSSARTVCRLGLYSFHAHFPTPFFLLHGCWVWAGHKTETEGSFFFFLPNDTPAFQLFSRLFFFP